MKIHARLKLLLRTEDHAFIKTFSKLSNLRSIHAEMETSHIKRSASCVKIRTMRARLNDSDLYMYVIKKGLLHTMHSV